MSIFLGSNLKITVFGESHGPAVGVAIDGLPPGLPVQEDEIALAMARRAPGQNLYSTPRMEKDEVNILSGVYQGKTTGTPLCAMIANTNVRRQDYGNGSLLRPGHADYTGMVRYQGFHDPSGGGHFSGRLTAPLVFAGVLAAQWLNRRNIVVGAHAAMIGHVADSSFDPCNLDTAALAGLKKKEIPVLDDGAAEYMKAAILEAGENEDSVGGIIECAAYGLPAGWGSPMFAGVENVIASLLFAIPAVKGVEFGAGFAMAEMRGSEANDPFILQEDKIVTATNHNGGVNGGITNGMPLILRAAVKPTPSIGQSQKTVDMAAHTEKMLSISGRHDPCIVLRAVPVVEAAVALALMDIGMEGAKA